MSSANQPLIESLIFDPSGPQVIVTWTSTSNQTYTLQAADLPTGPWDPLVINIPGEPERTTYTHPIMDPALLRKVFRVAIETDE